MVLLDTCALIWLANGDPMRPDSIALIEQAGRRGELLVSPVSAWEIGLLATSRKASIQFLPSPQEWLDALLARPGIRVTPLSAEAALGASYLPGELHGDPGDRLLVSTARVLGATLITRDGRILEYGRAGFVQVLAC
jgi:PIN domain nuclease of toxin-antitoxin system